MAASVTISNEDPLAFGWRSQGTQLPKTGSGDIRRERLRSRIRALGDWWERLHKSEDVFRLPAEAVEPRELWRAQIRPLQQPAQQSPPPYEDSLSDLPPDYSPTDTFAIAYYDPGSLKPLLPPSGSKKLDLDTIDGIRSYANKKKKKAAQAAKWNDDEEEKKEEGADGAGGGEGGDNGCGEGGAEGAGDGAGGDPPGGDGGGGGGDENPEDDWFSGGGKKNKKKKKKNAFEEFEEEEKKREEEEAKLAEEAGDEPPPAEPEPDPIDDWGSFAPAGGKKKKKKGKAAEPEPEPEPEPAPEEPPPEAEPAMENVDLGGGGNDAAAEANPDDMWGFATTGKKKKGKKGKCVKVYGAKAR
ncbi:hypothetical protein KC336_g15109 [Hortaea werneckii]|nr:hypothetical protein KC336_g15109 [Hortaea werneckii]